MRALLRPMVLLCLLSSLAGCASTWDSFIDRLNPNKRREPDSPEEAQRKYVLAKQKYDRDLRDYESTRSLNQSWREGYGFNNPNPERIRKGEKPVDFLKEGRRPTPPRNPAD